ncbi:DUF421 domain-containing protein [Fulvivirga sp. RKSG066]|uniref:DUF421 domain-containing protein n=1 Tax=Fulvivirga aurantia TaxID=2529383 RepID=UPI0012BBE998|nr:YetF domain-containing protein [Fulvivirga aurantia]MTI20992.1 DUF421 domain-containing protein [Fulvivirga aurantia]
MEKLQSLNWLLGDVSQIVITVFNTFVIYAVIIIITKLNGLRTFAKMGSFDFAITIAIGSLIASTILSGSQSLIQCIVGLSVLIGLQALVAKLRKKSKSFEKTVTNTPVLLMKGSQLLEHNLAKTRVSHADLYAKLREANVTDFNQIYAVVLETTGDISVLHGSEDKKLSDELLKFIDTSDKI